ncbi:MAG: hypothetical protein ACLPV4_21360 [Solirubrobacteraceae bacterium]
MVRSGDALGLIGDRITHAECALVHWLASSDSPEGIASSDSPEGIGGSASV